MKVKLKDLSYFRSIGFITLNDIILENGDDMLLLSMPGKEIEVVECSQLKKSTGYDYNSVEYGFFIKKEFCEELKWVYQI